MFRQVFAIAAFAAATVFAANADVTPVLDPSPEGEVTNLATVKVTFPDFEIITKPTMKTLSASLVNETTGTRYQAVDVTFSWSAPNGGTIKFGLEGTTTALTEIKEDGTYKLTIAAGSFINENVSPAYSSPVIEATYTIGGTAKDSMTDYTLTPAVGSLSEIGTIRVDFPDTGFMGIQIVKTDGITLSYIASNSLTPRIAKVVKTQYTYGTDCGLQFDWEDATVPEPMTFRAPGTYTLQIPASSFKEFGGTPENRLITAEYTIEAQGGRMSQGTLVPAPGEVESITTIDINFGGNGVSNLQWAEDPSAITLTRKGDNPVQWHCASITAVNNYTVRLSFARQGAAEASAVTSPGEYLLYVPAGVISGYTADGRKSNDAIQALYNVTGSVNNMDTYTISPAEDTVTELRDIVINFPQAADGVTSPADLAAITLAYTPEGEGAETVAYTPNGFQANGTEVTIIFGNSQNEAFTADGTYVFTVPQGTFGEFDNPASSSPLISKTYVIDNTTTGIEDITIGNGDAPVYNVSGILVRRAGDTRPLPAGLYISNGRKIIVK